MSSFSIVAAVALVAAAIQPAAAEVVEKKLSPPVIIGKYYEQNGGILCSAETECQLVFSRVPTGKTLTIQNVACEFLLSGPTLGVHLAVFRSASDSAARPRELAPTELTPPGATSRFYVLHVETRFPLFGSSPAVSAILGEEGTHLISCQISGDLAP